MRKLFQINYLILILAVFVVVYRQAFMQRYDKFYYEEGKKILAGNSDVERYQNNKHLFFYETKGLHQNKPLLQFTNETIKIDIYEISYPDHSKKDIHNVVTYLMPIITADENVFKDKNLTYGIYFASEEDGDIDLDIDNPEEAEYAYWFEIINFLNLDIYMADTGFGELIPTITSSDNDLILKEPINVQIFAAEAKEEEGIKKILIEQLFKGPINIGENSFPIRNSLIQLFHEKEANNESLNITSADIETLETEQEIFFTVYHNASKYNTVLYKWFGGYLMVVLFTAYFVFFFRRGTKHLGKVKPTKALKESIEKVEKEKKK